MSNFVERGRNRFNDKEKLPFIGVYSRKRSSAEYKSALNFSVGFSYRCLLKELFRGFSGGRCAFRVASVSENSGGGGAFFGAAAGQRDSHGKTDD